MTWTNDTPRLLELLSWEQTQRTGNVNGSPHTAAPADFAPIANPPDVYTHIGHDAQYGAGRRNGRTVRMLVVHTTQTDSFDGSMRYNARRTERVSATAHTGRDGEIGYGVPEDSRPWTTGRWNDETLSLEVCGDANWTAAQWRARPAQMAANVTILTDWCRRHDIPGDWLDADAVAAGASRVGESIRQGTRRGITDHHTANLAAIGLGHDPAKYHHWDVGPGLRQVLLEDTLPEVRRRLAAGNPDPDPEDPTMTKPAYLIRFKKIGTFTPQGELVTDELIPGTRTAVRTFTDGAGAELEQTYLAVAGGPLDGVEISDSQFDEDPVFFQFVDSVAFDLGRRAERNNA